MHRVVPLLIFLFVVSPVLAANPVEIKNGFGTGEDYLSMTAAQQQAYAMGVINGMLLAPLFGAPKIEMNWLETCVVGMSDTQIAAILTKYLRDHPGRWHETPHAPMYAALREICMK